MSAFRGYLQGHHDMRPTAFSQLIESIGKIIIALPMAWFGSKIGMDGADGINIGYAVAGAMLGTSIAEAIGAALHVHRLPPQTAGKRFNPDPKYRISPCLKSPKEINRKLFSLAIPVTIGASIIPLSRPLSIPV